MAAVSDPGWARIAADMPTDITVRAAEPGQVCVECAGPARFVIIVARPGAQPFGVPTCRVDLVRVAERLVLDLRSARDRSRN